MKISFISSTYTIEKGDNIVELTINYTTGNYKIYRRHVSDESFIDEIKKYVKELLEEHRNN
jgi:hypothetical protein